MHTLMCSYARAVSYQKVRGRYSSVLSVTYARFF